jgi:hypothetical protein
MDIMPYIFIAHSKIISNLTKNCNVKNKHIFIIFDYIFILQAKTSCDIIADKAVSMWEEKQRM